MREVQIQSTVREHYTPTRRSEIKDWKPLMLTKMWDNQNLLPMGKKNNDTATFESGLDASYQCNHTLEYYLSTKQLICV